MQSGTGIASPSESHIRVQVIHQHADDNVDLIPDNTNITIIDTVRSLSDGDTTLSSVDCFLIYLPSPDLEDVIAQIKEADASVPCIPIIDDISARSVDRILNAGASDVVIRDASTDWKRILTNRIQTVVNRVQHADSPRYQTIMEAIEDGIYTLDDDFKITWVNDAATSMLDYTKEELIGAHSSMLTDEGTLNEAAQISHELRAGVREMGRLETEIEPANGESFPIETHFTLLPLENGNVGQVGVFRDISERKEYEETLTELYHSTRELLRAESKVEICQIVSATAADVLDLPAVGVYLLGGEPTGLDPVAMAGDSAGTLEEAPPVKPSNDSTAWKVFVDEDSSLIRDLHEDRDLGAVTSTRGSGFVVPLGEFGVFVAGADDDSTFDVRLQRLVDLLCTVSIAALESQEKQDTIHDRDRELTKQARQLTRLHHINETIRKVQQSLVQANTRDEVEESVVDQLASDERIDFVYIGEVRPDSRDIVPRSWGGTDQGYLDQITVGLDSDNGEPASLAARQQAPVVIDDIGENLDNRHWRKTALSKGYRSVISVPLVHNDLLYGVLTVFSKSPSAVGQLSLAVFQELGETIGYAINSIQSKRNLANDSTVELEIGVTKPDELLIRMARHIGCRLTFQNVIPKPDGTSMVYFRSAEPLDDTQTLCEEIMAVEDLHLVAEHDGGDVYEARVDGETIASTLMDYGAATRSIDVDGDEARAVIELPTTTDVRSFIETVQRTYPDTELLSRRTVDPGARTQQDLIEDLEDRLTERQLEVLRSAFVNGYFQWPRDRTGEEVASTLGIAQPTFNRHLREGERKLFEMLFAD